MNSAQTPKRKPAPQPCASDNFTGILRFSLVLFHRHDVRTQAARVLLQISEQALPMFAGIASKATSAENPILRFPLMLLQLEVQVATLRWQFLTSTWADMS